MGKKRGAEDTSECALLVQADAEHLFHNHQETVKMKYAQERYWSWCRKFTRLKVGVVCLLIISVVLLVFTNIIPSVYYSSIAKYPTTSDSDSRHSKHLNQSLPPNSRSKPEDHYDNGYGDTDGKSGRIRYKHTHRSLPQVVIIGARKAGTRALLTFLNMHPQVQVAKNEVHFFDDDEKYSYGYEWYRKRMPFSFPGQITIEKSPAYFVNDASPSRLHAMNSSIKLLLIVRDPVERAVSDYLQIKEKQIKLGKLENTAPFEELAIDSNTGDVDNTYNPIKRSLYYRYMRRWLEYFSLEQIHIISGEQLVENPASVLNGVENFLGIEHRLTEKDFYFNESRGFYCLNSEAEKRCLVESKGRPHPKMDPIVRQRLQNFFRPYNHRFYRLVNRDFGWP